VPRPLAFSLPIALVIMTGLSDLVVLLIGKLYGEIQEHAPLPTFILALVCHTFIAPQKHSSHSPTFDYTRPIQLIHRFFQKYEPQSPGVCAFLLFIMPAVVSGAFKEGASSILGPLLRTYAIFHTTLISSIVLYRLSPFHPLAKYPGPVLAKMSKLWFVSVLIICGVQRPQIDAVFSKAHLGWQGKQYIYYRGLHKKYGSVVRVGTQRSSDVAAFLDLNDTRT